MTKFVPMVETLAGSWLALQCQMIPKIHRGAVYLGVNDKENPTATAYWPEGSDGSPALTAATRLVIDRKCPVLCGADETTDFDGSGSLNIACPIIVDGCFTGVVAVEVASPNEHQQRAIMQLLQWGSTWLEFLVRRESSSVTNSLMTAIRVVATCLEHGEFQAAATTTVTELATHLGCERVSIGFRERNHARVRAISNSAIFDKKTNLVRDLEAVMEEALAQGDAIVFPGAADSPLRVTAEHAAFAKNHGADSVCTIPLVDDGDGDLYGALVFERAKDRPFDDAALELCEVVASLLGPILELKRKDSRWIGAIVRDEVFTFLGRVFGRGHTGLKLALIVLAALIGYLSVATGEYRVTSKATLESIVQRVVVAPMDGFIASAATRAGDLVRAGEILARLEDKDLQLERAQWAGQREQLQTEYRQALAQRDRALTRVLNAQIVQTDAQLNLIDEKLLRTDLTAPFDGVIVWGDLSQQFGAPVERGQVLFEVAPLDAYRVVLQVDEREISSVRVGQTGQLALTALSGEAMDITVVKITPVSSAADGHNFFRVEARLEQPVAGLRPGMLGVGKVDIAERKLVAIWTYKLVNWWRLWLWSWWA
ncbi:MAG: HlyD family efflux transporter periplasmic adaptor subunit [Proteobacteria bacterium]|nr:MAG: HlyD family efflux transporter periplasmic adaptor subunit [Pseudomonadota bacterium]